MTFKFLCLILMSLLTWWWAEAAAVCHGRQTFSCLDCHMLQVCPPKEISTTSTILVNCSLTNRYCDSTTGSCSTTPPSACVPADNFTCLSDGYFPDPSDCRTFHLCAGLIPTRYVCDPALPSYYYYDVVLHRCIPTATCIGYSCSSKTGVKVAHPADKNLFAFCLDGAASLQDHCPSNYELDENSQQCTAVCKTHGILPDIHDCRNFYRCVAQNGGFLQTHEQCPDGHGLSPLSLQCEENTPYCPGADNSTSTTMGPTTTKPINQDSKGLKTLKSGEQVKFGEAA